MKIDRLIGIITVLLRQERTTAPELAERFEVSRRTISRDIEDLCKAGIPIVTAQGRGGGISIAEGYRIDKTLLTVKELQSILIGLRGLDSVSPSPLLRDVAEKLSPSGARSEGDGAVVIDLASFYRPSLTRKISELQAAIRERRRISFRYFYEKGESRRTVEPYRLVFKWSDWYVWGWCRERGDFRLFKLNRLWELETEESGFAPRELPEDSPDFDRHFSENTVRLKALFEESEKYRLVEEYGPDCFTEKDGRLLLERDFANRKNMLEWVSSFADRVEVLEPLELREELRKRAENILRIYGGT